MSEILKDLVEYLQNKIDSGEHKIFFNDLGWEVKTIDCINAINKQQEKIERLNNIINECANEILIELKANHHLSYGVALSIRQKLIDYKELKGVVIMSELEK